MASPAFTEARRLPVSTWGKIAAYSELTKPRLTLLVVFSAFTGFYLASAGSLNFVLLFFTVTGIGLASSGALALNQYLEREYDAKMRRTRHRPLPGGRLLPLQALLFGILLCVFSVSLLWATVNGVTALLVSVTILSYLLAYTPLKRRSPINTAVGALPGALPIVCGWTAVRQSLDWESLVLFAILYLWQFPHFLSIALLYREDYRRAGYKMLPAANKGLQITYQHIVVACLLLLGVSVIPTIIGMTGMIYLVVALLAGGFFLMCGLGVAIRRTDAHARRLMLASFIYPLLVWGFLIIDKVNG